MCCFTDSLVDDKSQEASSFLRDISRSFFKSQISCSLRMWDADVDKTVRDMTEIILVLLYFTLLS
jgi:hypothetical protein